VLLPDLRGETLRFIARGSRKELVRLALAGKAPQGITFAPDGRTAFLSFSATGKVAVIDIATRTVLRELDAGQTPDGVAYTSRRVAP
jgi:DNA-binding beta-propeller fold protein YncE